MFKYKQASKVKSINQWEQIHNRARQLYKNISMLSLFPVKYGKLSKGVNAQCFKNYITTQHT